MYLIAIFVFTLASVNAVPGPDDCDLVPPKEPVDWSKLPGDWYEILNSGDRVDKISPCYGSRDFAPTENGFRVTDIDYHLENGTYGEVPFHAIRQQSGLYNFVSSDGTQFEAELDEDITSQKALGEVHRHAVAFTNSQAVFYTDYKNYFMYLVCKNKKDRRIWVHGRNQEATADDVLRIHNKLAEIGYHWGDIPLYVAECGSANVKSYIKEELPK